MTAHKRQQLAEVLAEVRTLVANPNNDFAWSSWVDVADALGELDQLSAALAAGQVAHAEIRLIFAPTGPLQELSVSSGWSDAYQRLAQRVDALLCGFCR
ncbi:MAG: hypothetical protein H6707_12675 [Deltaproteobacteria bacterium]|nr:hypothetical protein [Deltaproteobacteria bacterium]